MRLAALPTSAKTISAEPAAPISPRSHIWTRTIGGLLDALKTCGFAENTIVVFTSDHGDMLGERGLWFKMNFFEGSARVPLMIAAPGRFAPRSVNEPTSLLDVLPTLVELAGGSTRDAAAPLDGASLVPLASGGANPDRRVVAEYAAEGRGRADCHDPRGGRSNTSTREPDPPLLFNLAIDPQRAHEPRRRLDAMPQMPTAFAPWFTDRWDLGAFDADVPASQARRHLVYEALRNGHHFPWDFQPLQKASERYMRNHMDLNEFEASARYPKAPDGPAE